MFWLIWVTLQMIAPTRALFNSLRKTSMCRCVSLAKFGTAKASSYNVAVLPGDGIGPEITRATIPVLESVARKCDFSLHFCEGDIGGAALDRHKDPFPDDTAKLCHTSDSVLLACIGGHKWDKNSRDMLPETGLLRMRKRMGLFANLRPAKVRSQLVHASSLKPSVVEGVDLLVVRELTGGLYFGTPSGIEIDALGIRRAYNTAVYTELEIERIARVAMGIAQARGGRVCSVDKANVLDVSQLWREVVTIVALQYPSVSVSHMYVDNCAMQLIRNPRQFDVILTSNMFGDILSDQAAMLVGSLGMLPSASLGDPARPGLFEPCHGSAPDIAGTDRANPLAMILSGAMMLRYDLNQSEAAEQVEQAVDAVLDQGLRTADIYSEGCKLVGCQAMGETVVRAVESL